MKNIVKVLRFKDNAARLYALPEDVTVKSGTLVTVEFPTVYSTATGITVSDSYAVDETAEKMVAEFHRINPPALDGLKRVLSIYTEAKIDWPADDADEDDTESEDEDEPDEDDGSGIGQTFNP